MQVGERDLLHLQFRWCQVDEGLDQPSVDRSLRKAADKVTDFEICHGFLPELILQRLGRLHLLRALAIALYARLTAEDFESGLVTAVYHGGDSDSAGAIAGNALGLMFPDQALSHRWSSRVACRDAVRDLSEAFSFGLLDNPELLRDRFPRW